MNPPTLTTKRRIKRIAPLQLAKMLAILYGLMGLIFIPFFLLMTLVASQMPASQRVGVLALGAGFTIFVPIIYAAIGFVFGALGALIYNLVAKWIGGIEVEVE
jgi:pilus assembly protein TadC